MKAWNSNGSASVDAIASKGYKHGNKIKEKKSVRGSKTEEEKKQTLDDNICKFCRGKHEKGKCPAYGKICFKCKRSNHFAVACFSGKKVHAVNESKEPNDDFFIDGIQAHATNISSRGDWFEEIKVNGHPVQYKIDTGAQVDLIPEELVKKLQLQVEPEREAFRLFAYGGTALTTKGSVDVQLTCGKKRCQSKMVIVEKGLSPLLGLTSCEKLGLIQRSVVEVGSVSTAVKEKVIAQFPQLFDGIGCMEKKYSIKLKNNCTPVIQPTRRVPFSLRGKLKTELERMQAAGIIRKVEGPTEWVNSLVIVEKSDGSLRLCLDPRDLNENIQREHFQLPTREELEAELKGAKYFSKLDARSGFYQVPLEKESEEFCTFNTPFGRYCFRKLPFGLSCSPEVFHQRMVELLEGLDGLLVFLDDLLIWGSTMEEHNTRLMKVLKRLADAGLTLNAEKCEFCKTSTIFLGDHISGNGIEADPTKVKAVLDMPTPTSKAEVLRALGTVNYLSKYIPNLSSRTDALRTLLRRDCVMEWNPEHEKEWEELKHFLASTPVLRIYDPALPFKVAVDASNSGLGAVLLQKEYDIWRPVAYASRALTHVETRYAPIEKEALGLVFGFLRFHNYVYGKHILAETDHKPLTSIVKKSLNNISPRLQRLFMKLLRYQFDLVYVPGRQMVLPDALSRAPLPETGVMDSKYEDEVQIHVNLVLATLPIGDRMLERIRVVSEHDPEIRQVVKCLADNTDLPLPYASFQDELSVVNGLLMRTNRIVVPSSLRNEIMKRVHEGHLGLDKCLKRARQCVYWPGFHGDLKAVSESCYTCNLYRYQQRREPYLLREVPGGPWERVGVDLFQLGGHHYVVVYDAFSNYPEVEMLPDTSTTIVVEKLSTIFARHGIPLEVNSDNGPQFASREFQEFVEYYGFSHVTSSSYYPQSNGLAEKGVQIVKRLLKKSQASGDSFQLALLNYRSTPLLDGRTPSELLMGRRLRTRLPDALEPAKQVVQKHSQGSEGSILPELQQGDAVLISENGRWARRGTVKEMVAPRSYLVETEEGGVTRRNRIHLLRLKERCPQDFSRQSALQDLGDMVPETRKPKSELGLKVTEKGIGLLPNTETTVAVRRSTRVRKAPDRLQY